jgi:hypothetical protein
MVSAFRRRAATAPMFTIKAHHEAYYAVFARKTMEDALAKANELVDAGYSAVTIHSGLTPPGRQRNSRISEAFLCDKHSMSMIDL